MLRDDLMGKGDSTKRLESEVYCLKNMLDGQQVNLNTSEFLATQSKGRYGEVKGYDIGRACNTRDTEKILELSEKIENLTRDNVGKDRQVRELEDQIASYSNYVQDNCKTISEMNSKNKKEAMLVDELRNRLVVTERKFNRLVAYKRKVHLES